MSENAVNVEELLKGLTAEDLAKILGNADTKVLTEAQKLAKDDIQANRHKAQEKALKENNVSYSYNKKEQKLTITVDLSKRDHLNAKHTRYLVASSKGSFTFDEERGYSFGINVLAPLEESKIKQLKEANDYNIDPKKGH